MPDKPSTKIESLAKRDPWVREALTRLGREAKVSRENITEKSFRPDLGDRPFATHRFEIVDRQAYVAEVGRVGEDYLFHLYAKTEGLRDRLGDQAKSAFEAVFRRQVEVHRDRLVKCLSPDCLALLAPADIHGGRCPDCGRTSLQTRLDAWSVRVPGMAGNPLAGELPARALELLDQAAV